MRVRWIKVWVDAMATLTERFRDEEGRVDFEALGREEYAFRHALVTGDFSRSERARDLYDATINEITSRSEAGRKGAEARWSKNTADGDPREDSQEIATSGNGSVTESGTSANHYDQEAKVSTSSPAGAGVNLDSTQTNKRPDASSGNAEGVVTNGSTITRNGSRVICTSATSGQTIDTAETLDKAGEGGVSPEVGCQASLPPSPISKPKTDPKPVKKKAEPEGEHKFPHGEFENIMLTTKEYIQLCERLDNADSLIDEADQYFEAQPDKKRKYKSHYAMLLNWSRRKAQESKPKQGYMTSDDISKKNYEESKARLEAMFSKGRKTA